MDIVLQLHITGNCNLRCKHCYIDEHSCEMPYSIFKSIINQFLDLCKDIEKESGQKVHCHLHMTGGEPFCHTQINKILFYLFTKKSKIKIGIMSNGTLLSKKTLLQLKVLNLKAFQVSVDGSQKTHDEIRELGNYEDVIQALLELKRWHIPTRVSFTANSNNYVEFPAVAKMCRTCGVKTLWSDRYIPINKSSVIKPLNSSQMKDYISILQKEHNNIENKNSGLFVENNRSLQFIGNDTIPYYCRAGENLIVVDEHGNIMPCRRMPIVCGNISDTTLSNVYFENEVFKNLRNHDISGKCKVCEYKSKCKGGSRCMAYAVCGDFNTPDPGCFL